MKENIKKRQIIKCYMDEILPYLQYNSFSDNLKISTELKYGDTNVLNNSNLKDYINYKLIDRLHIDFDFNNSSIKDVYKGFAIISKRIMSA